MFLSSRCIGLALEWSCHGVPWFIFSGGWILGLLISNIGPPPREGTSGFIGDPYVAPLRSARNLYGWRAACLLFALILDVLIVGCLKFLVKRPRPEANYAEDMLLTVSIDDWSFPSGEDISSNLCYCGTNTGVNKCQVTTRKENAKDLVMIYFNERLQRDWWKEREAG